MRLLRTPDTRFGRLPGYPFEPRYAHVGSGAGTPGVRMHFVDEGPSDGRPVVMLHDVPSWSFGFRRLIADLRDAGRRVVAPDLVGFGRSDKPADAWDHSLERHVAWITDLLDGLDLRRFSMIGAGWGGMVALRLTAESPHRVERLVALATALPTGDRHPGDSFLEWQRAVTELPELRIGDIIDARCSRNLTPRERAAYDAPFPDEHHKAGPRAAPLLVPTQPHDPATLAHRRAWDVLEGFTSPVLRVNGADDPLVAWTAELGDSIPGAAPWPHVVIEGASHLVTEDRPAELSRAILEFLGPGGPDGRTEPAASGGAPQR